MVEHAGHESTLNQPEVRRVITAFLGGTTVSNQRIELPRPRFRGPSR